MSKYYVSAKRSNANGVIESLTTHLADAEGKFDLPGVVQTRTQVVTALRAGHTFWTITKQANGKWAIGAEIKEWPVTVHYLKTVQDNTAKDNLDSLPSF